MQKYKTKNRPTVGYWYAKVKDSVYVTDMIQNRPTLGYKYAKY